MKCRAAIESGECASLSTELIDAIDLLILSQTRVERDVHAINGKRFSLSERSTHCCCCCVSTTGCGCDDNREILTRDG